MGVLVSVIIPVYNTSKYLDMCLDSVVKQTYQELQIILVDDGSTDCSPQMCDDWAAKDSRIEVIHKQNEGLGYTRNAGLSAARGGFVGFLDSDDTIDLNTIEECVKVLSNQEADACYYGRKTHHADGSVTLNHNYPEKLVYSGEEVKREFAARYFGTLPDTKGQGYIQASACCAMYRRSIIEKNAILFPSERECMSEDTFFNLDVCMHAQKVIIILQDFYNYTYNVQSLTKKYNPNRFYQLKGFLQKLVEYKDLFKCIEDIDKRIAYQFYIHVRHTVEYEVKAYKQNGIINTWKKLSEICKDDFIERSVCEVLKYPFSFKKTLIMKLIQKKYVFILFGIYILK